MEDLDGFYRELIATSSRDFNCCFYCGCTSTKYDLVPPLKYASFYLVTKEDADFYKVPSCYECHEILQRFKVGTLAQRFDSLKRALQRKYKKALRVYQVWEDDELPGLDHNIKTSIKAGLELGREAHERMRYKGFNFEVDGSKHTVDYLDDEEFIVFEEKFNNFRDALDFASRTYQIPKATLIDLFAEHDNSFTVAIKTFQEEVARKDFERELKAECFEIAKKHKQNIKFIMRAVEAYMNENEDLSIRGALLKLEQDRLMKKA